MKKDTYLAYGEMEDTSAYLAEDNTYVDAYKGGLPRWAMIVFASVVVVLGVAAAIFVMNNEWSHNVDKYNKGAESTLRQDQKQEQEHIEKLNVMNSREQPWFSGDDSGTLYFHSEKFEGEKLVIPAAFDGVYITTLAEGFAEKNETIKEVQISEGIVTIESDSFSEYTALEKVSIPKTVKYIGGNSFCNTPWYKNIQEEFCVVGDGVLIKYCGKEDNVIIPVRVKTIDCSVFKDFKDAAEIVIPETVKYIGKQAFMNCTADISGGEGITYVANNAFFGSKWVEDNKDKFLVIGKGCMVNYVIENDAVYIPNGVRQISGVDFKDLDKKITLHISKDVRKISDIEQIGYVRAIKVDKDNEMLSAEDGVLYNKNRTMIYRYPVYKTNKRFYAETKLEAVGDKAFYGCDIEVAELYNGVKTIGNMAFYECANLEQIELPDSLIKLGNKAFYGCEELSSVALSDEVTVIPYSAFSGCENLEEFICSESLTTICSKAFYGCENLKTFTLPKTLKKVIYDSFEGSRAELFVKDNPYFEIKDNKITVK